MLTMRNNRYFTLWSLSATLLLLQGKAEDYEILDNDIQDNDDAIFQSKRPEFLTDPGAVKAAIGESVTLPCKVANLEDQSMLIWTTMTEVIFANRTIIHKDDRFRIVNGTSLYIANVQPSDSGEYFCAITTDPVISISHNLKVPHICGGDIVAESGIFTSPNYPDFYRTYEECIWKITVPENRQVILQFQSFDLEGDDECMYDFVQISNGHESHGHLLGKFCGENGPDTIRSSTNKMAIRFVSDGSTERQGFTATFTAGKAPDEEKKPSDTEVLL